METKTRVDGWKNKATALVNLYVLGNYTGKETADYFRNAAKYEYDKAIVTEPNGLTSDEITAKKLRIVGREIEKEVTENMESCFTIGSISLPMELMRESLNEVEWESIAERLLEEFLI